MLESPESDLHISYVSSLQLLKFTASSKGVQLFFFFLKNGVFEFPPTSYFIDKLSPEVVNSKTTEVVFSLHLPCLSDLVLSPVLGLAMEL